MNAPVSRTVRSPSPVILAAYICGGLPYPLFSVMLLLLHLGVFGSGLSSLDTLLLGLLSFLCLVALLITSGLILGAWAIWQAPDSRTRRVAWGAIGLCLFDLLLAAILMLA